VATTTATTQLSDAVIVGGGVIGLACAWRAAERGLDVVVVERDRPGAGASRVAAGMLAPVSEASWGEERLLELGLASHRIWPGFAAELGEACGRDVGYLELGSLHLALDRDEADQLRRRYELMRAHGLAAEWLSPSACRRLEPGLGSGGHGGVHAPHEAAVDPPALIEALAAAFEAAGGRIEIATVTEGVYDGDRLIGVRSADGVEYLAGSMILAAGSWSAAEWLPARARPPIRPVKGQILTLAGPASRPVCARIVAGERFYAVPRADGRLVIGATVEELGFDTRVTAGGVHELLREAYRALPEIAELELVEAVAGLRPATPDNLPLIGRGAIEGLLLATGHFRNGILLAPLTADRIASILAGDRAEAAAR
jgi:glycine oxidase